MSVSNHATVRRLHGLGYTRELVAERVGISHHEVRRLERVLGLDFSGNTVTHAQGADRRAPAIDARVERNSDEILRLCVLRESTPHWLRDEIDEQIRRLRA